MTEVPELTKADFNTAISARLRWHTRFLSRVTDFERLCGFRL